MKIRDKLIQRIPAYVNNLATRTSNGLWQENARAFNQVVPDFGMLASIISVSPPLMAKAGYQTPL
ncbi:hypothetical protein IMY05_003G0143800 [Salix suchowensis]|nr:hypothetical protein IMY05_003G0143800 [Salix suchowensis]